MTLARACNLFISYLASFILVLLFTLSFIFATPWGSQLTITAINAFSTLKLEYDSGTFAKVIKLKAIQYHDQYIEVSATDSALDWQMRCLLKKQLCFKTVASKQLSINLLENDSTSTKVENNLIVLPFAIVIHQVDVKHLAIADKDFNLYINDITGNASLKNSNINLNKITIANANLNLKSPVETAAKDLSSQGWQGVNLPDVFMPINLVLNATTIRELQLPIAISETSMLTLSQVNISANYFQHTANISQLEIVHKTYGKVALTGSIETKAPYGIDAKIAATSGNIDDILSINNVVQLNDSAVDITLNGDLSALNFNLNKQGNNTFYSEGKVALTNPLLNFTLLANGVNFPTPQAISLHLKDFQYQTTISGNIEQQQITVNGNFSGAGYANAHIASKFSHQQNTLVVEQFDFNDKTNQSDAQITGEIAFNETINWQVELFSTGFNLPNISPKFTGRVQGSSKSIGNWHDDRWQLVLKEAVIFGVVNQRPAKLIGDIDLAFAKQSWALKPSNLTLELNESTLTLTGFSDEEWHLTGKLTANNLSHWLAEFEQLNGQISSEFTISGPISTPKVNFSANVSQFNFQHIANNSVELTGQYQPFIFNDEQTVQWLHKIELSANMAKLSLGAISILPSVVELSGDKRQQTLTIKPSAITQNTAIEEIGIELNATGSLLNQEKQWHGVITEATVSQYLGAWQLSEPLELLTDFTNNSLTYSAHCWIAPDAKVCLDDASVAENQGKVKTVIDIDLAILNKYLMTNENMTITSNLHGETIVEWQNSKPFTSNGSLTLSEGYINFSEDNESFRWSESKIDLISDKLSTKIKAQLFQNEQPVINSHINISHQKEPEITGDLSVNQLRLVQLLGYLPALKKLNGDVNANLTVQGKLFNPEFTGEIYLNNLAIGLKTNPTEIDQINATVTLANRMATIHGFGLIGKGKSTLNGKANWLEDNFFAEINIAAKAVNLLYPPDSFAIADPDLTLTLHNKQLTLTGKIAVEDGLLKVDALPESSLSPSEDIVFVDDNGQPQQNTSMLSSTVNVDVFIANKFAINAMGFSGKIGGTLSFSQQPTKPLQVFGDLNIEQGLYKAYGQNLTVQQGQILFNGAMKTPYLNVRAARIVDNVTAGIQILGAADNLVLSFYSNPTFDQNEILSYIVRGRGLDNDTGAASPLALVVGSGISSTNRIFKQLERIPLLSEIEVDTQGDGDQTQATISGYIGDKIYLKYGIGVFQPISELTLRLYLMNKLWIETVSSIESSVDIYYSFDID